MNLKRIFDVTAPITRNKFNLNSLEEADCCLSNDLQEMNKQ